MGHRDCEKKWKPIFGVEFDFNLASEFVVKLRRVQNKLESLRLTDQEQIALATIQSRALADRWRALIKSSDAIRGKVRTAFGSDGTRVRASDLEDYFATLMSLLLAGGRPTPAMRVYGWMTGKKIRQQKMSSRAKWLRAFKLLD
jgi:hypothetical protein